MFTLRRIERVCLMEKERARDDTGWSVFLHDHRRQSGRRLSCCGPLKLLQMDNNQLCVSAEAAWSSLD